MRTAFDRAVRSKELWQWATDENGERHKRWFHFHDLRHTYASWQVQAGVPLNTVRELVGHKYLTMTLRYARLAPQHRQAVADVLDAMGDAKRNPPPQVPPEVQPQVGN